MMLVKSMLKVSPASRPGIGTVLHRLQHLTLGPSPRQPMKDSEPPEAVSSAEERQHTGLLLVLSCKQSIIPDHTP